MTNPARSSVMEYWIGYRPGWAALYYANTDSSSTICTDSIYTGPFAIFRCHRWIQENPNRLKSGIPIGFKDMKGY